MTVQNVRKIINGISLASVGVLSVLGCAGTRAEADDSALTPSADIDTVGERETPPLCTENCEEYSGGYPYSPPLSPFPTSVTNAGMTFSASAPVATGPGGYGVLRTVNTSGGPAFGVGGVCLVQRAPTITTQATCLAARPAPDGNGTPNFGQNYAYWLGGQCYLKYSGPFCNIGLSVDLDSPESRDYTTATTAVPGGTGGKWHSLVALNVQPMGCASAATEYNTSYCKRALSSGVTIYGQE